MASDLEKERKDDYRRENTILILISTKFYFDCNVVVGAAPIWSWLMCAEILSSVINCFLNCLSINNLKKLHFKIFLKETGIGCSINYTVKLNIPIIRIFTFPFNTRYRTGHGFPWILLVGIPEGQGFLRERWTGLWIYFTWNPKEQKYIEFNKVRHHLVLTSSQQT